MKVKAHVLNKVCKNQRILSLTAFLLVFKPIYSFCLIIYRSESIWKTKSFHFVRFTLNNFSMGFSVTSLIRLFFSFSTEVTNMILLV